MAKYQSWSIWTLAISVVLVMSTRAWADGDTNCGYVSPDKCNECGPHTNDWFVTCPTLQNTPSVSPSTICNPYNAAPISPSVTPPTYDVGEKWRTNTYDCQTNRDIEHGNINYTPGDVFWVPPLPPVITNSFSSTACVNVTSDDPECCASPGLIAIGSCTWNVLIATAALDWQDPALSGPTATGPFTSGIYYPSAPYIAHTDATLYWTGGEGAKISYISTSPGYGMTNLAQPDAITVSGPSGSTNAGWVNDPPASSPRIPFQYDPGGPWYLWTGWGRWFTNTWTIDTNACNATLGLKQAVAW